MNSQALPDDAVGLVVDRNGQPLALQLPKHRQADGDSPGHRTVPVTLRVAASVEVAELAQRIAARPQHSRFDPVVCVDDLGRATGVIHVEAVLLRLAALRLSST